MSPTDDRARTPRDGSASADDVDGRWIDAASLDDIPDGWFLTVELPSGPVALARTDGDIHAIDATCGHAGGPLGDGRLRDGCVVECPWHAARFHVGTGQPAGGPARKAQRTYQARISGATIQIYTG